jgi:hypothetical protein
MVRKWPPRGYRNARYGKDTFLHQPDPPPLVKSCSSQWNPGQQTIFLILKLNL